MYSSMIETFVFIKTIEQLAMQMKYAQKAMFDEIKIAQPLMLTKKHMGIYPAGDEPELADNQYYIVHTCLLDQAHHDILSIYGDDHILITYTVDEEGDFISIESMYDEDCPDIYIDYHGNITWTLQGV